MAKIRGIKPETWTDEKIVSVSPLARLLFFGMWNFACDNGHLDSSPIQLKMRILPVDNCDVGALVQELAAADLVTLGDGYVKVPNLAEHQKPDRRYLTFCDHCLHDVHTTFAPSDKTGSPSRSKAPHGVRTSGAPRVHDVYPTSEGAAPMGAHVDGDGDGDGERKRAPKGAAKPVTIEHHATDAAYQQVGKAFNFMAVRAMVKWAIHDRGEKPERVTAALVAIHGLGKPITKQTIGQYLDGTIAGGRPSTPASDATLNVLWGNSG